MSGVLAAIRLEEAGIPYTVIEKNPAAGGTWYENHYPGCRVDVGNHFYCYSFEPNNEWTEFFARQPELRGELTGIQWLGFALVEAVVFYALLGALLAFVLV